MTCIVATGLAAQHCAALQEALGQKADDARVALTRGAFPGEHVKKGRDGTSTGAAAKNQCITGGAGVSAAMANDNGNGAKQEVLKDDDSAILGRLPTDKQMSAKDQKDFNFLLK